jgi:hypothetical protein
VARKHHHIMSYLTQLANNLILENYVPVYTVCFVIITKSKCIWIGS